MSEQGQPAADSKPESTLIQQDGAIPETVIPPEPVEETPETEPEPEKPAAEAAAEQKPKRTPWYQERIDTTTRQKNELKAELEAARAEIAALKPKEEGEQPAFDPKQFEQVIEQRAEAKVAQREFQKRSKGFIDAGNKEFGPAEFMERCNEVAALGAGDSVEFMQLVTDPDIIPDGHKVIAALAEQPEEAQRILSLDPVPMSAALARFALTAKVPDKKLSNAPAPIKPLGGTAKASAPSDNEPIQDWMAKRRAELAAKGKH